MARNKVRARDIKKQRWAGIIAAILALGMILGLFGPNVYYALFGNEANLPEQHGEPEPQDYLNYYESEVARIEAYLDENEATEEILLELAENYRYLVVVQQVFFNNEEAIAGYQDRLISIYSALVEIEPSEMQYRLELAYLYFENRDDNRQMLVETSAISDMLRVNPDPLYHLSLIQLLEMAGEDSLVAEELDWLEDFLGNRVDTGTADNNETFYYAVLQGEYRGNVLLAKNLLEEVIENETEGTRLYQNALSYLEYFQDNGEELISD